jgi:1,2-dihydroxy-3-keto-5-methylthiopentene dioxygenase
MAIVRVASAHTSLSEPAAVAAFLSRYQIDYEQWTPGQPLTGDSTADEVLAAYAREIATLKARGGYLTADVIDVKPDTPNLDAMLARFSREHWHDEDEVRFIVEGRGLFHVHPADGQEERRQGVPGDRVFSIEVQAGDLIRVPRGTQHWFDLCGERRIRAIRLFQDPSGWTPHYTDSGIDKGFEPVCFGPAYVAREPSLHA